jgi:hypothetical protein
MPWKKGTPSLRPESTGRGAAVLAAVTKSRAGSTLSRRPGRDRVTSGAYEPD